MTDFLLTPEATASFVHVDTPVPDQRGVLKYSCVLLFDKKEVATNPKWAAIGAMVTALRNAKWSDVKCHAGLKTAIKDGDTPNGRGNIPAGYAGHWVMNVQSKFQPQFAGPDGKALLGVDIKSKFYPGCRVVAQINAYAYDMGANAGVSCGLGALQWIGDGKRLVEKIDVSSVFAPVPGSAAAGNGDSLDDFAPKLGGSPF